MTNVSGNAAWQWTRVLVYGVAAAYVTTIVLNALAGSGKGGVFNQSTGNVSNKYPTFITPAGWAFSIWGVIYTWLGLGICYCVSTLFRSNSKGPLYRSLPSLTWMFYLTYFVNLAFNIGWVFIWDAENLTGSAILLVFIAYTGWLAIGFASYGTFEQKNVLPKNEYWMQTVLVQNGIGLYTTWTSVASLLNIAIAVQHAGKYPAENSSIGPLSILIILLVVWFALENTILDKYVRWILVQYPVVIYAVAGILSRQTRLETIPMNVFVLTCVVEALACSLFVIRLVIVIYKQITEKSSGRSKVQA